MESELVVVGEPELIELGGVEFWEIYSGASVPPSRRLLARSSSLPARRLFLDPSYNLLCAERALLIEVIGHGLETLKSQLSCLGEIGRTDHLPEK